MNHFSSYDELKEFVATLTPEQRAFVSFRAAARCFPFLSRLAENRKYVGSPDDGLSSFRTLLNANLLAMSSAVEAYDLREKAEIVSSISRSIPFYSDGHENASNTVGHAVLSLWDEGECYGSLLQSVMAAREFSPDLQIEPLDPITGDRIELSESDYPINDLFTDLDLMDGRHFAESIELRPHEQAAWDIFLTEFRDDPNWSFWARWFESVLAGQPLPSELLLRIVSEIEDDTWKNGPAAVAHQIEGFEIELTLAQQIEELREQFKTRSATSFGIGHNNPPPDDATAQLSEAVTIIWADLSELGHQSSKTSPEREVLEGISASFKKMASFLKRLLTDTGYDVLKGGLTLAAGTLSTVAWPRVVELLEALSKTIDKWLAYLILGF